MFFCKSNSKFVSFITYLPLYAIGDVCALHDQAAHTLCKLDKKIKNTNKLYEVGIGSAIIFQRVEVPYTQG